MEVGCFPLCTSVFRMYERFVFVYSTSRTCLFPMDHDGIQLQLHKYLNKAYMLAESLPVEICGRYSNCKGEDSIFFMF